MKPDDGVPMEKAHDVGLSRFDVIHGQSWSCGDVVVACLRERGQRGFLPLRRVARFASSAGRSCVG